MRYLKPCPVQLSGVVLDPYRGARSEGVGGFFRGVKSGVTGAAVKPLVAVLDAATFGFEQVADQIGSLGEIPVCCCCCHSLHVFLFGFCLLPFKCPFF